MGNSWFDTGFSQAKNIQQQRNQRASGGGDERKPFRFFVKVAEESTIVFLDDFSLKMDVNGFSKDVVPVCLNEHRLLLDENWQNEVFVTCTMGSEPCFCCEQKYRRQYVGAMTILDLTPRLDKRTNEVVSKPWRKFLVAVPDALLTIDGRKSRRGGNLQGCKFSVTRHEKKQPRVGSDYDFIEKVDLATTFPGVNLEPFGLNAEQTLEYYKKQFKPLSYDECKRLFAEHRVSDGFNRTFFPTKGSATPPPQQPAKAADDSEKIQY